MPTLRILADGTATLGSAGYLDTANRAIFDAGEGDKITMRLDYTGWLGADTLSSATWYDMDSATATAETIDGAIASALITIPGESTTEETGADDQLYRFRVVSVSSAARQHVQRIAFMARGR